MANEPAHTALKEKMVPGMPKSNFTSEHVPNNQLRNRKGGGLYDLFSAMLYTVLQMKNSSEKHL